jgi:hypothetical protein
VEALQTNISSPTTSIALHQTKRFGNMSPVQIHRQENQSESSWAENTPQSLAGIVYFVIRLNDIPSRKQTFALSAMQCERGYFDKMCTKVDLIREKVVPKMFHSDRKLLT